MVNFSLNESKLLGNSPEIERVRKSIRAFSKIRDNVLILGDVGSGRTFTATSIHRLGNTQNLPFITIPCGAIGDTIEKEDILGGADKEQHKNAELFKAGKGTIYLQDVDRLHPDLQDRLYNLITTCSPDHENGHKMVASRIIASAEPSLEDMARKRKYNFALYQELSKARINVPSIQRRRQDIIIIFTHFIESYCEEFGKPIPTISYEIFEEIIDYDWPGNVEEIKNCVRNMIILSPEGELSPEFLPFHVQRNPLEALTVKDLPSAISEVERFLIRHALARFEGNQSKAANLLQVSEAALRYKMKKYGF